MAELEGDVKREVPANPAQVTENLQVDLARPERSFSDEAGATLKNVSSQLVEKGIMPAMSSNDIPQTLAQAAKAMEGNNLGIPADHGLSSASSVSTLLKAVGADVRQTMAIPDLHKQLADRNWQESEYKADTKLRPGDLLFTSMDPNGRNVGVVGEDGKIYSHNFRVGKFVGREQWNSKFVSVMRAPTCEE
ncbi:MAG: hypothetical protein SFV17_14405 [Candidatus Obscuribacter sp.]|nr:hypothetical protein [Candidatus Melainabacteria bacterium]MDX1987876.1 hypothetical protein [Candidatus Obscuribacter sp.]